MERNYKKWLDKINAKQDKLQNTIYNIGVGKKDATATERLDVNGNVKANGFKTPTGSSTQALTADGGVFDLSIIAGSGNTGGVDNSHDYSAASEIQVGKLIYLSDGVTKSKPKYRKVYSSTLGTNTNPDTTWQTNGFGIIYLPDSIDNIISISADFNLWSKKVGFGLSVFRNAQIGPVREVINHVNIGYSLSENANEIYIDGFVKTFDEALTPSETTTYHLPNDVVYNLYIEYTKTTDPETIISIR